MMKKTLKIIFLINFLLLYGCGFEPIFSSKNNQGNLSVSINEINFKNYSDVNDIILNKLKFFQDDKIDIQKLDLELEVLKNKKIILKNKVGNPETFNLELIVNIIVKKQGFDEILRNSTISSDRNYSNLENKFDLKQEERVITNNLVDKITDKIISMLFIIE